MFGFGVIDAETIANIYKMNQNKRKPSEDFNSFFNTKYHEAIKSFIDKPKFSMKYFLVMANIRQVVFEQSKKDYISKYNLDPDYFEKNKVDLYKMNTPSVNTSNVETTIAKEISNEIASDTNSQEHLPLRRSNRIRNKNASNLI